MSTALKYDALFSFGNMKELENVIRRMQYALDSFPDHHEVEFTYLSPENMDPYTNPLGDTGYVGVTFKSSNGAVRQFEKYDYREVKAMGGVKL